MYSNSNSAGSGSHHHHQQQQQPVYSLLQLPAVLSSVLLQVAVILVPDSHKFPTSKQSQCCHRFYIAAGRSRQTCPCISPTAPWWGLRLQSPLIFPFHSNSSPDFETMLMIPYLYVHNTFVSPFEKVDLLSPNIIRKLDQVNYAKLKYSGYGRHFWRKCHNWYPWTPCISKE